MIERAIFFKYLDTKGATICYPDTNHIDNLVAIALKTEVILSKIHKAYRLRNTQFSLSILYKRPRWSGAALSCACLFNDQIQFALKHL